MQVGDRARVRVRGCVRARGLRGRVRVKARVR